MVKSILKICEQVQIALGTLFKSCHLVTVKRIRLTRWNELVYFSKLFYYKQIYIPNQETVLINVVEVKEIVGLSQMATKSTNQHTVAEFCQLKLLCTSNYAQQRTVRAWTNFPTNIIWSVELVLWLFSIFRVTKIEKATFSTFPHSIHYIHPFLDMDSTHCLLKLYTSFLCFIKTTYIDKSIHARILNLLEIITVNPHVFYQRLKYFLTEVSKQLV